MLPVGGLRGSSREKLSKVLRQSKGDRGVDGRDGEGDERRRGGDDGELVDEARSAIAQNVGRHHHGHGAGVGEGTGRTRCRW